MSAELEKLAEEAGLGKRVREEDEDEVKTTPEKPTEEAPPKVPQFEDRMARQLISRMMRRTLKKRPQRNQSLKDRRRSQKKRKKRKRRARRRPKKKQNSKTH